MLFVYNFKKYLFAFFFIRIYMKILQLFLSFSRVLQTIKTHFVYNPIRTRISNAQPITIAIVVYLLAFLFYFFFSTSLISNMPIVYAVCDALPIRTFNVYTLRAHFSVTFSVLIKEMLLAIFVLNFCILINLQFATAITIVYGTSNTFR